MGIANELARGMKNRRANATLRLEHVQQMNKAVRVVASFNRVPSKDEATAALEGAFQNRLAVVPNSFRIRKRGLRVTVAGFMCEKIAARPIEEAASLREVASNVFMDPSDSSIWNAKDGMIIRSAVEDLSELASLAKVEPTRLRQPELALATVRDFVGPKNTQVIAYVDPAAPEDGVKTAIRVDEDTVYSHADGIGEVTQDMIVDTENLAGMDLEPTLVESASVGDQQSMVDYYSKVYGFDPAYFDSVEEIIKERALV